MKIKDLRLLVTEGIWEKLESVANKFVTEAMGFELVDQYGQERYFHLDFSDFRNSNPDIYSHFHNQKICLSPEDVIYPYFQAGVYLATDRDWKKYEKLRSMSSLQRDPFYLHKDAPHEALMNMKIMDSMGEAQQRHAFIVPIWNFTNFTEDLLDFEEKLQKLLPPEIRLILTEESARREHAALIGTVYEQHMRLTEVKEFFSYPSIMLSCIGTNFYAFQKACVSLRIVCDLFRVSGYIFPGQLSSDIDGLKIYTAAMVSPGSVGTCFNWEDEKKSIKERRPDGNLFQSHGHRRVSKMFIDSRNYGGFLQVFEEWLPWIKKAVDDPFDQKVLHTLIPISHLLSEVTQAQSVGSKILLLNCCLESMFVPNGAQGQQKYIVGALKVINEDLVDWFEKRLYRQRCVFAHEGYLVADEKSRGLVIESMRNILACLKMKLG